MIYYASVINVGLDERTFLPSDDYLVAYMNKRDEVLEVGPTLYIAPVDYDFTQADNQNLMCSIPGCNPNSLMTWFHYAPFISNAQSPEYSWLDGYLSWSGSQYCCLADFDTGDLCSNFSSVNPDCEPCFEVNEYNRPSSSDFEEWLPTFLGAEYQQDCPVIGQTFAYNVATGSSADSMTGRFRLYYSILQSEDDFINAIKNTYAIIDDFELPGIIAYSDFFLYYEQFLDIKILSIQDILLALGGVFLITLIFVGNPTISLCICGTVAMIIIDTLGAMSLWNLKMNPVALVNLLMGMGISIEFCVHIGYAWTRSHGTPHDRAYRAIVEMFSVVISGVTISKMLLVVVLGLSATSIFKVKQMLVSC